LKGERQIKVAICNGGNSKVWGFGLSTAAMRRISELKHCYIYCYDRTKCELADCESEYTKIKDNYGDDGFVYYMTEDAGDITNELKGNLFTPYVSRNDPFLIQVIEELGSKAFAYYSNIRLAEIPDGTKFNIKQNVDNNGNYIEELNFEM